MEQLRVCERSLALTKSQLAKTEITLIAVEQLKSPEDQKIYRSVGRMFIISTQEEIGAELKDNLKQISVEAMITQPR